ncbi:MAG: type II secretion system protein [Planctomycetota bacterium]|jgi:prepilin-type N-terminal cleavage/methylation domain-containing protein
MNRRRGFTIVELLVVVSIIALLIGILLPAIGKARDQARLTMSQTNVRQLGQAMATYAAEWNDRQMTVVDDNLARYGSDAVAALTNFSSATGRTHPGVLAGYGANNAMWGWWFGSPGTYGPVLNPINFDGSWFGFGWFRSMNVRPFTGYLNGTTHDPVFFAPKDTVVLSYLENCLESPYEFDPCYQSSTAGPDGDGNVIYPTYVFSPAALYSPSVFRAPPDGGWQDPYDLDSGLKVPAMSPALYPDMKMHIFEHHWLQQRRADCNAAFGTGTYDGCEPYYFNHSWESVPVSSFFDGHVEGIGVREAEAADSRAAVQSGHGLWSRDTGMGSDGYFIAEGYDFASTSFGILTTNGIRGRDKLAR